MLFYDRYLFSCRSFLIFVKMLKWAPPDYKVKGCSVGCTEYVIDVNVKWCGVVPGLLCWSAVLWCSPGCSVVERSVVLCCFVLCSFVLCYTLYVVLCSFVLRYTLYVVFCCVSRYCLACCRFTSYCVKLYSLFDILMIKTNNRADWVRFNFLFNSFEIV